MLDIMLIIGMSLAFGTLFLVALLVVFSLFNYLFDKPKPKKKKRKIKFKKIKRAIGPTRRGMAHPFDDQFYQDE